ncbi:MAG TPA: MerR family transcriptional regulator [Desulfobacterales bacterium]|nr:MerR family transcriptional regulator [Desulfobacterales bacterium]
MTNLTIGKLASQAGVSIDMVRFYERRGLIAEPERTASNYRLYSEAEVARLKFIKKAKVLGFSLNEIKELLGVRRWGQACAIALYVAKQLHNVVGMQRTTQ